MTTDWNQAALGATSYEEKGSGREEAVTRLILWGLGFSNYSVSIH